MLATPSKPRLSAMLGQVATIAKVSTTSLGLKRHDKQASTESDLAHNAKQGTSKVLASRLAGAEHRIKDVVAIGKEAQDRLKARTTVWGDSQRLMSNMMIQPWLVEFTPLKAEYDAKVAQLIADAPDLIAQAEQNKGSYNVAVPTEEEIREAFSLDFTMAQIPDSATFAANGVEHAMQEEMRRHFERGVEAAYATAVNDALTRVADPLQHLIDRLGVYDKAEDDKDMGKPTSSARLYESTITHVQDIAKVFRSFNLTNDALMNSIADRLDAFDGIDITDLKGSPSLRRDLTKKAAVILDDLRDLI